MSHFTRIKTSLVIEEYLILALKDLGHTSQTGSQEIRGYGGKRTKVQVSIPTKNSSYQIGFQKVGDKYEMVADWYGIHEVNRDQLLQQLTQRYAYHAARAKLEEQGFTLVNEESQKDGQIHLVLRRMV